MTMFSKNVGGTMAPLAPYWLRLCCGTARKNDTLEGRGRSS